MHMCEGVWGDPRNLYYVNQPDTPTTNCTLSGELMPQFHSEGERSGARRKRGSRGASHRHNEGEVRLRTGRALAFLKNIGTPQTPAGGGSLILGVGGFSASPWCVSFPQKSRGVGQGVPARRTVDRTGVSGPAGGPPTPPGPPLGVQAWEERVLGALPTPGPWCIPETPSAHQGGAKARPGPGCRGSTRVRGAVPPCSSLQRRRCPYGPSPRRSKSKNRRERKFIYLFN